MNWAWVLLLLVPLVSAAELHGTVYDFELKKVPLAVVEVNSSPAQRLVAVNGTFSFLLAPGEYEIVVSLPKRNLSSSEVVEIEKEGSFVYDVILLPDVSGDDVLFSEVDDVPFFEDLIEEKPASHWFAWLAVFIALAALVVVFSRKGKKSNQKTVVHKEIVHERVVEKVSLAEDVQQVMVVLEQQGGRASQKDIRKELPFSEAKVSLMIDELEKKELVERIKKGRGNVIVKK